MNSDQQEVSEYQRELAAQTKAGNAFAKQTQAALQSQRQFNAKLAHRLNAANYVDYFTQANAGFVATANQVEVKRKQVKQQIEALKADNKAQDAVKLAKLKAKKQALTLQNQTLSANVKANQRYLNRFNQQVGNKLQAAQQNVTDAKALVDQDTQTLAAAQSAATAAAAALKELIANHDRYAKAETIMAAAQVTPMINVGHGQTMSYNPVTKKIYLVQDETLSDLPADGVNTITEINPDTLQPIKQFNFPLLHDGTNMSIHTLTFDSQGNAYFGRKVSATDANGNKTFPKYQIFQGALNEGDGTAAFAPVAQTINWGGYSNQDIAYDAYNNRMYIISDNIITSVPTDKLGAGDLQPSDVQYMSFDINREFEDLAFDNQGYGYLLTLWEPELMKTAQPL